MSLKGIIHNDIGVIVGMEYIAESDKPAQWYYHIRFLKCDYSPLLVGSYNLYYKPEDRFVADNSAIADYPHYIK